jgi:hypothetical protein
VIRWPPVFCGTLLLFICSRAPLAAEPEARPAGRRVELIVAATTDDMHLVGPPIREMLAAKNLQVVTIRKETITGQDVADAALPSPREPASTLGRVLVDLTVPGQATLFLIDPRRGRVYVRRMALERGLDAVARASALFVIEQSIDAILDGREIGVSREEFQRSVAAPPPPPRPPPPPPPRAPLPPAVPAPPPRGQTELLLSGGYECLVMGSGNYQHAGKLMVAARFTRFQLAAAARVAAPISIAGDGVQARLSGGGVSLSGAGRLVSLGNLSVVAGLGAGLDVTRVQPAVTMPELEPAAAFWARGPSLHGFAEIERLFGRVSVAIAVGAEAHLLAERYTVRSGGGTRDVFVPLRLRPGAAVRVGVVF